MCRLAGGNKKVLEVITRKQMLKIFNSLEHSFGGDGNGLGIMLKDKTLYRIKGEKLKNEQVVNDLYEQKDNVRFWMYHTRMVSSGFKNNNGCHPHYVYAGAPQEKNENKKVLGCLSQNGTIRGDTLEFLSSLFGGSMDCEIIANSLSRINVDPEKILKSLSSVWLYMSYEYLTGINAASYGGDLVYYPKIDFVISEPSGILKSKQFEPKFGKPISIGNKTGQVIIMPRSSKVVSKGKQNNWNMNNGYGYNNTVYPNYRDVNEYIEYYGDKQFKLYDK